MESPSKKSYKVFIIAIAMSLVLDGLLWRLVVSGATREGEPVISFLEIGQGDSSFIEIPNSKGDPLQILIDGGPKALVLDELTEVMPPGDRSIDLVIMTHPETDHFRGLVDVLRTYNVSAFVGNGRKGESEAYTSLHGVLKEKEIPYITLQEGDKIRYRDAIIEVLGPSHGELVDAELNISSLVVRFVIGEFSALFTGDIGAAEEKRLVEKYDLKSTILKVPHHGSRFSSSKAFVDEINPAVAVIEVGKNNYGHPTEEAIENLKSTGARILRTDQNGTVRVVVGKEGMKIYAERE